MAEDNKAVEIIQIFEREESKAANFRTLYQRVSDLMFPRENQIIRISSPGEEKPHIHDGTGIMASLKMASGLSQNLVPAGQPFFVLQASDKTLNDTEVVQRYLSDITSITHEKLFASNFITQFNEYLRSLVVFGTACMFSEYVPGTGLNFRDYDVGQYLIMENSKRRIDTVLLKFKFTARQAFDEWGDAIGPTVLQAAKDEKKKNEAFEFIHIVRPRMDRLGTLVDNLNMPFESLYVGVKERNIVDEGGFDEFPYGVTRWTKSSNEIYGRGQGVFALDDVRMLQTMKQDTIEAANIDVRPPLEVLESFEGEVDMGPGALNHVLELGSIRAVQRDARGNVSIGIDVLNAQQELVRKWFFNDVFSPLTDLTGDRRNDSEIFQRIQESIQQIGPPIGRINEEYFTPTIERSVFLLLRNGELPLPPVELQGQSFKIEFIGRFALELKGHQSRGFERIAFTFGEIAKVKPEILDILDWDEGGREMAATAAVSTKVIKSRETVEEIRRVRAEQEQAQLQLQVAEAAGKGYKDTSGAPEEGSPAAEVMSALGA